ncbi:unnamed protein product [Ilex paraguariensis]|uniref:TCP domain-containing protein n=1 Tax=Ilex paraguariensis TaxID=185542 RepID=A0ABC8UQ87_9AQUA
MGDAHYQDHHQQRPRTTSSRLGLRNSGGEIVEVQGGHIVRSTGRKDRHSKVCTAKGPRDRRVRLSAHTAIQFYDVQDRLGYDRPSKAVDWLIKKAKAAIDELAELPAWKPTIGSTGNSIFEDNQAQRQHEDHHQQLRLHHDDLVDSIAGPSSNRAVTMLGTGNQNQQLEMNNNRSNPGHENSSSFLPPSLDSDSIADTIKSFFPMVASTATNSSAIPFHGFPSSDCNLLSRTSSQSQDLRLSLQSFQDPILLHHHNQQTQHQHSTNQNEQTLYSGTTPFGFDSGWSENQHTEIGRFQRMVGWNAGGDTGTGGGGGGFVFNSPPTPPFLQPLFGQPQMFSQRGPLQSSYTPSIRAWMDPSAIAMSTTDHHRHQQLHQTVLPIHPSSISGIGFASGVGGFSGFRIPARIQGEEEEHDGISDKPSSTSSDSRH